MDTDTLTHFLRHATQYTCPIQISRNHLFDKPDSKNAAVLIPVVFRHGQWQIMLTRRTDTLRKHSGQIALPGGRQDQEDTDLTATALRETQEETGVPPKKWQTFPPLAPYYTPSGYRVTPIPALCRNNPPVCPNQDEVAEIFYLPLDTALDTGAYSSKTLTHNGQTLNTPTLPYRHHDIWGLTAMILYGLALRYRHYRQEYPHT